MSNWLWQQTAVGPNHQHQVACCDFPYFVADCSGVIQPGLDSVQFSWQVTGNTRKKKTEKFLYSNLGKNIPILPVALICQKNSRDMCCMIFKDDEHLHFLMSNGSIMLIYLLIDWLLARNYREGKCNETEFHRLTWCRKKTSRKYFLLLKLHFSCSSGFSLLCSVGGRKKTKSGLFNVHFALCTLGRSPCGGAIQIG